MRALVQPVQIDGETVRLRTLAPAGRSRDALGPTIVLLPGLAGAGPMRALHRALSRRHRTILVEWTDRRRHSAADRGGAGRAASLVAGALRTVAATDCLPIGHGQGAHVAVELRRADPGLVRAVGLVAPVTDDRRRGLWRQFVDAARDLAAEPVVLGWRVLVGLLRTVRRTLGVVPGSLRYPLFKRVAELDVPVLVLRGHGDVLSGHDWVRRLIGVAASGALIELPGRHHVEAEAPRAIAELVDEFLRVEALGRLF